MATRATRKRQTVNYKETSDMDSDGESSYDGSNHDEESEEEEEYVAPPPRKRQRTVAAAQPALKKRKLNDEECEHESSKEEQIELNEHRLFQSIASLKANQLKSFLKTLKSLRTIDGECVFDEVKLSGNKPALQDAAKECLRQIYKGVIVVPDRENSWIRRPDKVYNDNDIDFDCWKSQINQCLQSLTSQSKKSTAITTMSGALVARLKASENEHIVTALETLFRSQANGNALASELERLLPKPSLERVLEKHEVLLKAISKAQPNSRFGSSRDDYCFRRCSAAITAAMKGITEDAHRIVGTGDWSFALEFLMVTIANINRFPVWDSDANNSGVREMKKMMKKWHDKVQQGLAENVNAVQEKQLRRLAQFVDDAHAVH